MWLSEIHKYVTNDCHIMLVGNKSDLGQMRIVPSTEGAHFAAKNDLSFIETSALDSTNTDAIIQNIILEIYHSKNQ